MRFIDNIPYLTWEEAIKCFPLGTLKSARVREPEGYQFVKDEGDARCVFLNYSTLKPSDQEKVNAILGNPYQTQQAQEQITKLIVESPDHLKALREYKTTDGKSLPEEVIKRYAVALSYLKVLATISVADAKKYYPTKKDFNNAVMALIKRYKVCLPKTYSNLMAKVRDYGQEGALCIVHANSGNKHSEKITTEQKDFIVNLYADHKKPSELMVWNMYLAVAMQKGWPKVSLSAVQKLLKQPDNLQRAMFVRDPEIWKQRYQYSISTIAPSKRDLLWESDGTKLNLFYWDDKPYPVSRLQMYIVADTATRYILGYVVSDTENHEVVYKAYRNAVQRTNMRPYQIKHDNGGGHKSNTGAFLDKLATAVHYPAMPNNGQSKLIESIIRDLQNQVLRMWDEFTGMNITAKSDDSKLNAEWIRKNADKIPTKQVAIEHLVKAIEVWNHKADKTGKSPKTKYQEMQSAGQPVDLLDMVNSFWLTTKEPIELRKHGIKLQVSGRQYQYMIYKGNERDMQFMADNIGGKFTVKYDPMDYSFISLFKDDRFITMAEAKIHVARAAGDYMPGERTVIDKELKAKKKQKQIIQDDINRMANAEGAFKLGFHNVYKDELNDAEGDIQTGMILMRESMQVPQVLEEVYNDPMMPSNLKEGTVIDTDFEE